jgi:hypothetical protein
MVPSQVQVCVYDEGDDDDDDDDDDGDGDGGGNDGICVKTES